MAKKSAKTAKPKATEKVTTTIRFDDHTEHIRFLKAFKDDGFNSLTAWLLWLARNRCKELDKSEK